MQNFILFSYSKVSIVIEIYTAESSFCNPNFNGMKSWSCTSLVCILSTRSKHIQAGLTSVWRPPHSGNILLLSFFLFSFCRIYCKCVSFIVYMIQFDCINPRCNYNFIFNSSWLLNDDVCFKIREKWMIFQILDDCSPMDSLILKLEI